VPKAKTRQPEQLNRDATPRGRPRGAVGIDSRAMARAVRRVVREAFTRAP